MFKINFFSKIILLLTINMINCKYPFMSLSEELSNYLKSKGATEVGYADIADFTTKKGLNIGIAFYIEYPRDIIRNMENAPTREYVLELVDMNSRLDEIGMACEKFLIDRGYDAYAQTKKRLGTDFGEFNSFDLPHKTIATRSGLGWIGKSALLTTLGYGSALRISSVLTDAPLDVGDPVLESKCGKCMICRDACPGGAISGINWNYKIKRNDFYDDRKCAEYALIVSEKNFEAPDTVCGKCIYACPYTQRYIRRK
jgi:epoxyqueuosine reductase QueG